MQGAMWVLLVLLTLGSVAIGQLDYALLFAACKALLVGLEFMELRQAARAHLLGYGLFVLGLLGVLEALT